jgi:hypothetical protein
MGLIWTSDKQASSSTPPPLKPPPLKALPKKAIAESRPQARLEEPDGPPPTPLPDQDHQASGPQQLNVAYKFEKHESATLWKIMVDRCITFEWP